MAVIFNETFTGSSVNLEDHLPDTGHSWSVVWQDVGTDVIVVNGTGEGAASSGAGGGFVYTANTNAGNPYATASYTVKTTVTATPGGDVKPLFLLGRWQDTSNFYILGFFGTFIRLYKCVAGTLSQVSTDVSYTLTVNDVIEFRLAGSTLAAVVNGVYKKLYSDSSITLAGRGGLAGGDVTNRVDDTFSGNTWRVDSFSVNDVVDLAISVTDTVTVTESKAFSPTSFFAVSDTVTITESKSAAIAWVFSTSDSITVTDIPRYYDDTVYIADRPNLALVQQVRTSDSITLSESVSLATVTLSLQVTDICLVTENVNFLDTLNLTQQERVFGC
jgi:hypothetical protein